MNPELKPGDTVVALSSMCQACAVMCGLVSGLVCMWITTHKLTYTIVGGVAGVFVGFLIGMLVGPILFPASPDNVFVVKAGSGALPLALKGCLIAAISTSITIALLAALFSHTPWSQTLIPAAGIAIVIGVCWAFLASFL